VAVRLGKVALLAVAVGGQRRGGYLSVDLLTTAVTVAELLAGRPEFPDVRVRWSPYRDTCHVVEWGEPAPEHDDVARGRFYGYREAAITALLGHGRLPVAAPLDSAGGSGSSGGVDAAPVRADRGAVAAPVEGNRFVQCSLVEPEGGSRVSVWSVSGGVQGGDR
jgi:hypothetical protein